MAECVFCNNSLDDGQDTVTLREKGSNTINKISEQRGRTIKTHKGQRVHTECRRVFTMGVGSGAAGAAWAASIICKAMLEHGRRIHWPPQ